jgi:hypothetical protein
MPMSSEQERWDIYVASGTKEIVRDWLDEHESLSEFVRTAVDRELTRRENGEAA